MNVEIERLEDYNIYEDSIVQLVKMGDIIDIKYITAKIAKGIYKSLM